MSSDFLIVIPARLGSTRLPEKPLRLLCGRPLIEWVYRAVSAFCANVLVATDSKRVAQVVRRVGGEAVLTPSDLPSGTDRVAEAVRISGSDFKYIVNVQGDEPFVKAEHVLPVVERLRAGDRFATVAVPFSSFEEINKPSNVKVVRDREGYGVYFSRSPIPYDRDGNLLPKDYLKHVGIYGFRKDALFDFVSWNEGFLEKAERLEQLRILEHGDRIYVCTVEHYGMGVDTEEDLLKAEKLLKEKFDGC
ncbi:3-deoxy-manno-octulosonate cytidylyltransferase [Desulfurobacterium sp.]